MLDTVLYAIAIALIVGGLIGAILPALPGLPMIFGGIWLAAAVDSYRHLGVGWVIALGVIAAVGVLIDIVAASLGAKRIGASPRAAGGAMLGTLVGLFLGLPGLIIGPFAGALIGEFTSGSSLLRATHVGAATWLGLIVGTLIKLVLSLMIVAIAASIWLLHR